MEVAVCDVLFLGLCHGLAAVYGVFGCWSLPSVRKNKGAMMGGGREERMMRDPYQTPWNRNPGFRLMR